MFLLFIIKEVNKFLMGVTTEDTTSEFINPIFSKTQNVVLYPSFRKDRSLLLQWG